MGKIYKALKKSNSDTIESNTDPEYDNLADNPEKESSAIKNSASNNGSSKAEQYDDAAHKITQDGIDSSLVTLHTPHSIEAEQFRMLKNNILFPEKGEPCRSIMITSPAPNEGKSFVAANLAMSIAQSIDEYVLLIDCDLRSPTIHTLFGLSGVKGLSDYLSSKNSLSSVLVKTPIRKLTLLPGGTVPHNPSELLSSEQMRRLIHEVKLRYSDRYIIFDTPPPYITSDGNALSRLVDGIILIIRNGKTRKQDVQDIIDLYGKEKLIGVVHNFAPKRPGYGYGYYKYGYGYNK